jgi:hypothetical protein
VAPLNDEGKLIVRGMELAFDRVNRQGGIQGRSLQLVALDDDKDLIKATKNISQLQEKTKIFCNLFIGELVNEFEAALKKGALLFLRLKSR